MGKTDFIKRHGWVKIGIAVFIIFAGLSYINVLNEGTPFVGQWTPAFRQGTAAGSLTGQPAVGSVSGQPAVVNVSGSSQNPSLDVTVLDKKTGSIISEATVRVLNSSGSLVRSGTTSSGYVSLTGLAANTDYTLEILPSGAATAFYPFSVPAKTAGSGSNPIAAAYFGTNNGTTTYTVYNTDGITNNATTEAVTINQTKTFKIKLNLASSTNDNNYFGDGQLPIRAVVDYNSNDYTAFSFRTDAGEATGGFGGPAGHSTPDKNRSASAGFNLVDTQWNSGDEKYVYVTYTTGTIEPVNSGDANCSLRISFYDGARDQLSIGANSGAYVEAYSNDTDNADIGSTNLVTHYNCS